jgi:hypothetical protein
MWYILIRGGGIMIPFMSSITCIAKSITAVFKFIHFKIDLCLRVLFQAAI